MTVKLGDEKEMALRFWRKNTDAVAEVLMIPVSKRKKFEDKILSWQGEDHIAIEGTIVINGTVFERFYTHFDCLAVLRGFFVNDVDDPIESMAAFFVVYVGYVTKQGWLHFG